MANNTKGVKALLSLPQMHNFFQSLVGIPRVRKQLLGNKPPLKTGEKVLDIGCGTGELLSYLPSGIDYTGFDMEKKYIDYATKKFGNKGKFICIDVNEDIESFFPENEYDLIFIFSVFHHLTDAEVESLLKFTYSRLKKGGTLLTLDGVYWDGQSKAAKYILENDRGQYIRTEQGYKALLQKFFPNPEGELIRSAIRIPTDLISFRLTKK